MKLNKIYREKRKLGWSKHDAKWAIVRVNAFAHNLMVITKHMATQ